MEIDVCAHMPLFLTFGRLVAVPLAFAAALLHTCETCCCKCVMKFSEVQEQLESTYFTAGG